MKILAIIGSPHKGNTYRAVQQVEIDMKKCGDDVEFEYLFLKDVNMEPCRGCFACISKGEEFCPIKDDRFLMEEKMRDADGIILATPVYVANVSALTKNFIDRMSYLSHRPKFFDKYALALVTSCGGGIPETLKYLDEWVLSGWGFNLIDKLGIMVHPALKQSEKTQNKIQNASRDLYASIKEKKNMAPGFRQLMQFRIMKFNCLDSREHFSADYEFYKDRKDYYVDTRISPLKNGLAKVFEKIIIGMMGSAS